MFGAGPVALERTTGAVVVGPAFTHGYRFPDRLLIPPLPTESRIPVPIAAPVGLLTTCLSQPDHRAEAQVWPGFLRQP